MNFKVAVVIIISFEAGKLLHRMRLTKTFSFLDRKMIAVSSKTNACSE